MKVRVRRNNSSSYERRCDFMLNEKRREELNELLVDHRETLCAYWGEGVRSGLHKGYIIGAIGSTICFATVYGIIKLISRHKSRKES